MILKVLASGSKANCYVLENREEALILEAGLPPRVVLKELDFNYRKIKGLLISHEHKDHSKYMKDWRNTNVDIFLSKGTREAIDLNYHNYRYCKPLKIFTSGGFQIIPFEIQHDCKEPLGFLINHPDMGNLIFATDTFYIKNRFKNLNHILIECNYIENILNDSEEVYKNRVLSSHMSLENCISFLQSNDLSKVENIVLLHLSDKHSNEINMKNEVIKTTGICTYIANEGLHLNLTLVRGDTNF